ncbi:MAG: diaminopimelate epimerase [Canidatus Methanoxibalbensis ujae]|nr:diaminopimelate epimerase [Candidatus Methanoxibalbensis ujae]
MRLNFTKMHGCGNDFIVIDEFNVSSEESAAAERELSEIARVLCRRRFSVGADGLIFVCDSAENDVRMRIFNADGSEAEMSGNGIRCCAKYAYDKGIAPRKMRVETLGGVRIVEIVDAVGDDAEVCEVRVEMGKPEFKCVHAPFRMGSDEIRLTVLSIGNPHAVMLVDSFDFDVDAIGRRISALFDGGVNVNFVAVRCDDSDDSDDRSEMNEIAVRTYERGVGETLSCGTGSTASVFALQKLGLIDAKKPVKVLTRGCTLTVELHNDTAYLTGPAEKVYEGEIASPRFRLWRAGDDAE